MLLLIILFFTTNPFALAETVQGNSNTDKTITEQDLNTLKEEYYKDKIGLLQGNISNLIAFFSALIAIFAIGLTIFGVILNKKFTQKYEEMLQLNDTFQTFNNNARTRAEKVHETEQKIVKINEQVCTTRDMLLDRQELINSIPHSLQVLEINSSKSLHYNKFILLRFKCENMIKEIQFTFDNYDFTKYEIFNESSRQAFREVVNSESTSNLNAENYTKSDEVQKFVDIKDGLKRCEGEFLEYVNEPLTIEKFDEDTFDESPDFFNEWEGYFKDLELIYVDIQQSISNKLINKIEK